jgi:glycine cleavage system transcriptional repressor
MSLLAVTAVGADRPGIIARVTQVLVEAEGNLHDSSMTILGGQFTIVLLVRTDTEAAALETALADATRDLDLVVTVRPVGEGAESPPPTHVLSVYGADRPGLVAGVTRVLAEAEVNVADLTTRVLGDDQAVYAMLFEVAIPEPVTPDELVAALRGAADLGAVEVTLSPLDIATY